MKDRWEILDSKYIVDDRWMKLRADNCLTPAGDTISPYYVLEYAPWVNILPLTSENEVVLIKQYRHGIRQTMMELPGGTLDERDMSVKMAAERELLEETGYKAETLIETGSLYASPSNHTNKLHCFLAFDVKRIAEPNLEITEQIEVVLMPLDELVERAYNGELAHPHHISALFFALRVLKKA